MTRGFIVAVLGAESTGKTTLAQALGVQFRDEGRRVVVVDEFLREFCDREGRTPRADEQCHIATEQTRRIEAAAAHHELVIADTTALMIAVYSEQVFGDVSLYEQALAAHASCSLTLLTALDLPWQPDGLQRDGPQVREPVDARLRAALDRGGVSHAIVSGAGPARLQAALASARRALAPSPATVVERWQWVCAHCGDAGCERHLLPRA
jgi:nicotinamide riboside kinase